MTGWTPLPEWETEQPFRCDTCNLVLVGRELGYLPIMCEREGCPERPPERVRVVVGPVDGREAA